MRNCVVGQDTRGHAVAIGGEAMRTNPYGHIAMAGGSLRRRNERKRLWDVPFWQNLPQTK